MNYVFIRYVNDCLVFQQYDYVLVGHCHHFIILYQAIAVD